MGDEGTCHVIAGNTEAVRCCPKVVESIFQESTGTMQTREEIPRQPCIFFTGNYNNILKLSLCAASRFCVCTSDSIARLRHRFVCRFSTVQFALVPVLLVVVLLFDRERTSVFSPAWDLPPLWGWSSNISYEIRGMRKLTRSLQQSPAAQRGSNFTHVVEYIKLRLHNPPQIVRLQRDWAGEHAVNSVYFGMKHTGYCEEPLLAISLVLFMCESIVILTFFI